MYSQITFLNSRNSLKIINQLYFKKQKQLLLTSDPNEDGQAKAHEEDDEHQDEVMLGERVEPHGRQPAGGSWGEGRQGEGLPHHLGAPDQATWFTKLSQ